METKQIQHFALEEVNMAAIEDFCRQIYYCDPYTAMHAEHVADLMAGLANQMGMSPEEINLAYLVGIVHDVGKIRTPEAILSKPGRLTAEEYAIMKRHSEDGAAIVASVEGAAPIVQIMRHHHEKYDGSGYPDKLTGERIPLFSRMLSVCDAFDAMTTHRCYRSPVGLDECLRELKRCSGAHFDPEVCTAFLEFIKERFGFDIDKKVVPLKLSGTEK